MLLRNEQQLALNRIEALCIESADHFAAAARHTDDQVLTRLFETLAQQREGFAVELAEHIRALDDLPQQPDPEREAVQELVTNVKAFFSGDQRHTLIEERKKLERELAEAVRAGLQQTMPPETTDLLWRLSSDIDATIQRLEAELR